MPTSQEILDALKESRSEIDRLNQMLVDVLNDRPPQLGLVMRNGKYTVEISIGGTVLSLDKRPQLPVVSPGQWVRVSGGALMGPAEGSTPGIIATVTRIMDTNTVEVAVGSAKRLVLTAIDTLKVGHEVIVDSGIQIALVDLGRPLAVGLEDLPLTVKWSDIGGLDSAKAELREAIEDPAAHPELYRRYNKKPVGGVLLYGPPGCGKTLLAQALATAVAKGHGKMISVKGPELLNMYVGESERLIRALFRRGKEFADASGSPTVIFIDEADAILNTRGSRRSSDVDLTIVPAFLAEMQGIESMKCLMVLATNLHDSLDPAVVRDGRIDRKIHIPPPDLPAAVSILMVHLAGVPISGTVDETCKEVAEFVFGHLSSKIITGAMLAGIVDRATTFAVRREIKTGHRSSVAIEDFWAAVQAMQVQQEQFSMAPTRSGALTCQ